METNATLDTPIMNTAINEVKRLAESEWGGVNLSGDQLKTLPKGPWAAGWRFRLPVNNHLKDIDLVLDDAFPWSAPRLYMRRPPALGTLPHLEGDGFICVFPSRTPVDPLNPVGVVSAYLKQAVSLADQWSDPKWIEAEIAAEYLSYLGRGTTTRSIRSLSAPQAFQNSSAYAWRSRTSIVLSETQSALSAWLINRFGKETKPLKFERAVVLRLPELPNPHMIPRNAKHLLDLAENLGERDVLVECLLENPRPVLIGLVLPTEPHPTMVGFDLPTPRLETQRGRKHVTAGFRPQKMSGDVLIARRAGAELKALPLEVERLDAPWVHGRDQISDVHSLQEKKVTIIGCGSVGSGVATLLAKSGVGNLNLVDPEVLRSENIARHELGIADVGQYKASALAVRLRKNFPHLNEVGAFNRGWQKMFQDHADVMVEADLLVSVIGSWSDEGMFERWRIKQEQPPGAIYGWLESHGIAAHAVSLEGSGPCLGCGLTAFGQSRLKVTEWPDGSTVQTHPACGGAFQPYGAAQLAHGQSLVADLCIDFLMGRSGHNHRIWSAPERVLHAVGGTWTDDWRSFTDQSVRYGGEFDQQWVVSPECRICGNIR